MTVFQAELKYYFRSPIIWLILSFSAFVSAWSFLLTIDLFTTLQIKFASMSDAPSITQGIIFPLLKAQAKILMVVVAIIGGLSFARLADINAWSLLLGAGCSEWKLVRQKYWALVLVVLIFILPSLLAIMSLVFMADIQWWPVLLSIGGLLLLLFWMTAIAMLVSSFINNSGFAILLNLVLFMLLLLFAQSIDDGSWGKNWLEVLSPYYHFIQFQGSYVSWATVLYFMLGILLSLWFIRIRLIHKRHHL